VTGFDAMQKSAPRRLRLKASQGANLDGTVNAAARHIKILAWIHVVMSGTLLSAGVALLVGLYFLDPEHRATLPFLLGLFSCLAIGVLLPSLVGGIGLLRNRGWARVVLFIVSAEFLLALPVGTPLGGYGIWALLQGGAAPGGATEFTPRPPTD
jgi:hypothetical protein